MSRENAGRKKFIHKQIGERMLKILEYVYIQRE
jgi:hypothetical protein